MLFLCIFPLILLGLYDPHLRAWRVRGAAELHRRGSSIERQGRIMARGAFGGCGLVRLEHSTFFRGVVRGLEYDTMTVRFPILHGEILLVTGTRKCGSAVIRWVG